MWRWKVLSFSLARYLVFNDISWWNFYKKTRRLIREGYLIERTGDGLEFDVLQLTKKGFDFIKYDLGELKEMRFNAQSVVHDYWASAFQMGEFIRDGSGGVDFFTEQEVQCTDESLFPSWMPKSKEHIPDGLTSIKSGGRERSFAIEVELNLKPPIRYDKAAYYFDAESSKIDVVFWLCGSVAIAQAIFKRLKNANLRRLDVHHFCLTDDFKNLGWEMTARSGLYKGKTLSEIYLVNGYQTLGKTLVKGWLNGTREIFFPERKIPMNQRSFRPSSARPIS